jgi:hypothetical protein
VARRLATTAPPASSYRLTHSDLDFYVDVTVHERDRRYMATAALAEDSRDVGVGDSPREAVRAALRSLGEPYANEMAAGVEGERAKAQAGAAGRSGDNGEIKAPAKAQLDRTTASISAIRTCASSRASIDCRAPRLVATSGSVRVQGELG